MTDFKEAIESAERKCAQRGIKLTRRRREVLTTLLEANRALSAYELVNLCNESSNEPMPAMSVYRILEFLRAEQFVHKLETANKYIACKHIACEHEHKQPQFLICNDCHKVQELDTAVEALSSVETAASMLNFKLLNPQLEVSGSCGLCKT
mgnify:FL=1